ncbi:MAG TPA: mandelate racemase/muconate lactonizing enzyme family protein [Acidimicrobiales bacterium]|jgi:L-alanine-DL-glutamate epimerase-like enolase superfamily enzyme|nr:mandelate racemase/muconate lactonizing enzyme family protein [Acidimicrobiales bacterium]
MTGAATIAAVEPVCVSFPLEREAMSYCFVKVTTTDGAAGWGEACDSYGCSFAGVVAAAVRDAFAPLLVGQSVVDAGVEPLAERLRLFTRRRLGDVWVGAQARSAVELALWDVAGQVAGRSVSSLIGRVRDRVAVYASSVFLEEGDAAWHADLLAPVLDRGVTMVKVRVGPDWRADLDTLAKLRALLPPTIELMVDGSEIFTLPTAMSVAQRLHDLGVAWFEEPLPQGARAGIESLVARSPVPIAYGEHLFGRDDALDALRRTQLSILQPDASTCGGIAEARAMASAAASFGVRVVPHVCAGPVSLAANLHVAATVPAIRAIEYPYTMAPAWAALAADGAGRTLTIDAIADGTIGVPDTPGLGVALDEAVAAANPYRPPGARVAGTRGGLPDRFTGDR